METQKSVARASVCVLFGLLSLLLPGAGRAANTTNHTPYSDSFESYTEGFVLSGTNGWSAAVATGATVSADSGVAAYDAGCGLPLDTTHTRVLKLSGTVTNRIQTVEQHLVWIDKMAQVTLIDELEQMPEDAHVAYGFYSNGCLVVWHRDLTTGTNRWTQIPDIVVTNHAWTRLTAAVDYETYDAVNDARYFQIRVDGRLATNALAVTRRDGTGEWGGSWFAMAGAEPATRLEVFASQGSGRVDDLRVSEDNPLARTLEVRSAHGGAVPSDGLHAFTYGEEITAQVTSPIVDGATKYVCTGWRTSGNMPATGSGPEATLTVTNDAVLTWTWETNYYLQLDVVGAGNVDKESDWVKRGSSLVITADAESGHHFVAWGGDVEGCTIDDDVITMPMTEPRRISATFYATITPFRVADVSGGGDHPVITWYSVEGGRYSLRRSTNLQAGFSVLVPELMAVGDLASYEDPTAVDDAVYYYRLVGENGSGNVVESDNTVGYTRLQVEAGGFSVCSVPFSGFTVDLGIISSNSDTTIYDDLAGWEPGQYAMGVTGRQEKGASTFYVEITDSDNAFEGRYFYIGTNTEDGLKISGGLPDDVISNANALAGATYRIAPAWRVRDIFGEPEAPRLASGRRTRSADGVFFWLGENWSPQMYHSSDEAHWMQWDTDLGKEVRADNLVIDPDTAFFVRRLGESNVFLDVTGELRQNRTAIVLQPEYTLVGGFGWDVTIGETCLTNVLVEGRRGERVYDWEGDSWGPGIYHEGGDWKAPGTAVNDSYILQARRGYFLNVDNRKVWQKRLWSE